MKYTHTHLAVTDRNLLAKANIITPLTLLGNEPH